VTNVIVAFRNFANALNNHNTVKLKLYNIEGFSVYYELYFVLLNAFVGGYTVCKNMHGMDDIQIINMSSLVWSKLCSKGIGVYIWMGTYVLRSLEGSSVRSGSLLAHIVGQYLLASLSSGSGPIRRGACTWYVAEVVCVLVFTKYHLQWAWHCVVFLHNVYAIYDPANSFAQNLDARVLVYTFRTRQKCSNPWEVFEKQFQL